METTSGRMMALAERPRTVLDDRMVDGKDYYEYVDSGQMALDNHHFLPDFFTFVKTFFAAHRSVYMPGNQKPPKPPVPPELLREVAIQNLTSPDPELDWNPRRTGSQGALVKHTIAAVFCAATLVASLAACGSGDDKSALPSNSGGSIPSTTTTSRPTTTTPTATAATGSGAVALAARSTYTYGGLKFVVNLPADIPSASRPSIRLFSEFLQSNGRTTARNKLDPSLSGMASVQVVKETQETVGAVSVQGIGSVTYTISKIRTAAGRTTEVTGCLDQSKLVQVRKDGSHFVDANTKKFPTLKMTATINRGMTGPKVTRFGFVAGGC